ncbi:MAG: hypothetical protein PSX81_05640 [bacterium]|nr:hypothetical protein [bacterium]
MHTEWYVTSTLRPTVPINIGMSNVWTKYVEATNHSTTKIFSKQIKLIVLAENQQPYLEVKDYLFVKFRRVKVFLVPYTLSCHLKSQFTLYY